MNPKIFKINGEKPESELIEMASEILKKNGLVIAPTETRYGLLARADVSETVAKVYKIKRRSAENPLAVFVSGPGEIDNFAEHSAVSRILAERYLPGPLTLVLKAREGKLPAVVREGKIGIRCSSSPVTAGIVQRVGDCLTATSANLSGEENGDTIESIYRDLGEQVALYLDAGPLDNPGSTVIDCTSEPYTILREGNIPEEDIKRILLEN